MSASERATDASLFGLTRTRAHTVVILGVCLVVTLVYGSLLLAPPLSWDDGLNIFENPYFVNGSWTALWAKPYFGMYVPVIDTFWAALAHVGNGAAWPFRLFNVALHVANVVLFARLASGLLRRFELESEIGLAVGVVIFALHPTQSAAVSWISGSRDLAATTFALAAVGVYFANRRGAAVGSTLLFVAGLLCKPQIAGVPLAIVLYAWLFERRDFRRAAVMMSIWSAFVVLSAVITWFAQADALGVEVPLAHRPAIALDALGFYLIKIVWPFPLAADYGRTPDLVWDEPRRMIPTISAVVLAAAVLWWAVHKNSNYKIALTWPLVLLPVLGFVTFGYQRISTVADHYNYLPLSVLAALAAIAVARTRWRDARVAWALPAFLVVTQATTSWRRAQDWRDDDRFYGDMLAKNPASFSAQINLAASYCERGNWQTGLALVARTESRASNDPGFLANKAFCLYKGGRFDDVLGLQVNLRDAAVRDGLARSPRAASVFATSVAGAYDKRGSSIRAFAYLCQAQAVTPEDGTIAATIEDFRREFSNRGRNVGCPGLLPWDTLERVVSELQ
jgi:hypothetical protein